MNPPADRRWLALNFAATIFVSAFLLFQVQPLVSKYILPWFGGTPAVWTTCMLFFQTLLFGGYAYAHFSATWLKPKQQAIVHLVLIVAALLLLRVIPGDAWKPTDSYHPGWKILVLLTATVGLPYFVLSSTGPLIQAWFARSFEGRTPYRLFALSNVGSLLALLSYPFFFERVLTVHTQANIWAAGFIVYAALCGYAAMSLWAAFRDERVQGSGFRVQEQAAGQPMAKTTEPPPLLPQHPQWWRWPVWLLLPALASMTLLATTNHVCADMTPAPFLWVVPLALYLLTFIIAFDQPKLFAPIVWAIPVAMAIYVITMVDRRHAGSPTELYDWGKLGSSMRWIIEGLIHGKHGDEFKFAASPKVVVSFAWYVTFCFATMFGICMLCHGELYRLRPQPRYLTGYYLMIAAGGALGGLLVAIVAPLVFVTYVEWSASLFLGFVLAAGITLRAIWRIASDKRIVAAPANLLWTVPAFVAPLALLLIGAFDLTVYLEKTDEGIVLRQRNFFGAIHIEDNEPRDSEQHNLSLVHGRITHGMQFTDEERRHIPTTYYARDSGVGRTVGFYRQVLTGRGVRIGCIGLGTGTMAAYVDRGDSIRFYDINPAVIEISTTGKWFTYFTDAKERGGKSDVVLGDARLSLEREDKEGNRQHFDVLVLDAFSGDAIPVHLLTREAFKIYLDHLANAKEDGQDGAIAVHITNRYLDLEPVVLGLAEEFKLGHVFINNAGDSEGGYNSDWIILTHNDELLKELDQYAEAPPEERNPKEKPKRPLLWTDDFSNLFDVLR